MLKLVTAKKLRAILVSFLFLIPVLAHAQKPGSFYWGDSDMDGIISGNDYATLVSVYMDNTQDDAGLYFGYPQSRYRQDLDGDGLISGADISFLESWFVGDWNTYGAPATLEWAGPVSGLTVGNLPGDSVAISAISYSSAGAGHWPRTGFGIIFAIDPTSQCASTAQIYGFDPAGGATTWAWRNPLGYDYQPILQAPENGIASVKVRAVGCALGSIIRLTAYIPADGEHLIAGQRFPVRLYVSPTPIDITVGGFPPPTCETVAIDPASATIPELWSAQFRAICTLTDSSTTDCTAATTFGVTGNLSLGPKTATQQVNALHVPGEAGGSGTVIGNNTDCATPTATPATVTVTNDESLVALYVTPAAATILELGSFQLTATGTLSDATTINCNDSCMGMPTTWSAAGNVFVARGLVTGNHVAGCAGGAGTVKAVHDIFTSNTSIITVTNDESLTGIDLRPDAVNIMVGDTFTMNVLGYVSDGSTTNCNSSCCGSVTTWVDDGSTVYNSSIPPNLFVGVGVGIDDLCVNNSTFWDCSTINIGYVSTCEAVSATITTGNYNSIPASKDPLDTVAMPIEYLQTDDDVYYGARSMNIRFYMDSWDVSGIPANAIIDEVIIEANWYSSWIGTGRFYLKHSIDEGVNWTNDILITSTQGVEVTDTAAITNVTTLSQLQNLDVLCSVTYMASVSLYFDYWVLKVSYHTVETFGPLADIKELESKTYLATGTWSDGSTIDYTSASTISGDCSGGAGTITGNHVPGINEPAGACQVMCGAVASDDIALHNDEPPDTTITAAPHNPSNSTTASFEFTCNATSCTFECQMDGGGFASCSSPKSYSGLSEGSHNFQVRATDAVGNVELVPATYEWEIILHDYWKADTILGKSPDYRCWHVAVWTGTEMIVWGGYPLNNHGSRYDPLTDSWTPTSTGANVPSERYWFAGVWTGQEMIVWGGNNGSGYLNSGGRYNPSTDSWTATSTANAPTARCYHSAVWTGEEMIVWGGGYGTPLNTGGRYNPLTDLWAPTSLGVNLPTGRRQHTAIWSGSEMIVWGGYDSTYSDTNTGGKYDPGADSWKQTAIANAPSGRDYHTAVWSGSEMIIWGGDNVSGRLNTGGRYNPATDSWASTSTDNVPAARYFHTAVWAGTEMIIWGGCNSSCYNSGGRYNPVTDSWVPTSIGANVPSARYYHTAVWTETEMIVWGERSNSGGRYDPSLDSWTPTSTCAGGAVGRLEHTAVWTGTEMIVWGGGNSQSGNVNTGNRYDPATDSWTATSTGIDVPSARSYHTAIWTGQEMIIWGGSHYSGGWIFENSGGIYDPVIDSWTPTSTAENVPSPRASHTAIWADGFMIVWGGRYYDGSIYYHYNNGGKYSPSTDSWIPTSTTNAPEPRNYHTAVWTGTEMIVWGGSFYDGTRHYFNTGGRYDPSLDSWTPTSIGANVPSVRDDHTAVWTGTEMVVWGGDFYDGTTHIYNDGGRYDPGLDSWTPTSTGANVPAAKCLHTSFWTGELMFIWGGVGGGDLNTGGRYDPETDSWTPTSTADNVPIARHSYSSIWTGNEMIIWGGSNGDSLCSGGIYVP